MQYEAAIEDRYFTLALPIGSHGKSGWGIRVLPRPQGLNGIPRPRAIKKNSAYQEEDKDTQADHQLTAKTTSRHLKRNWAKKRSAPCRFDSKSIRPSQVKPAYFSFSGGRTRSKGLMR